MGIRSRIFVHGDSRFRWLERPSHGFVSPSRPTTSPVCRLIEIRHSSFQPTSQVSPWPSGRPNHVMTNSVSRFSKRHLSSLARQACVRTRVISLFLCCLLVEEIAGSAVVSAPCLHHHFQFHALDREIVPPLCYFQLLPTHRLTRSLQFTLLSLVLVVTQWIALE
jgi:hypothetical protein